jgi:hypothetical protein
MGRFERSDRGREVDVHEALRRAREEVARNRDEPPSPDTRGEDERELEEVEEAPRRQRERLSDDDRA